MVSEAERSLAVGQAPVHPTEEEPDPGKQTYSSQDFIFGQRSVYLVTGVAGANTKRMEGRCLQH